MKQQFESVRSGFLLLLAAFIWGIAFVAQSVGMDYMGPCTFNGARFFIGGVVLLPVIWTKERMEEKKGATGAPAKKKKFGALLPGGVCCGIALCAASLLQQFGIRYTSVGKAGFLTTLYIVIVPLLGIFVRRIPGVKVWCSVVVALIGMYRTGGCAGDWLRVCIFYSYSGGGSFRRAGGWRKAFVSAVSDERRHLSGACVFDGASVLECIVCRNRAGFIRGRSVQRRWVYASGCRTEKSGANSGIPAFEHGICFFRAGRLGDSGTEAFGEGAFGLRTHVCSGDLRTASG